MAARGGHASFTDILAHFTQQEGTVGELVYLSSEELVVDGSVGGDVVVTGPA